MGNCISAQLCLLAVALIVLAMPDRAGSDPTERADIARAEAWLHGVRMAGRDRLVAESPPPFPTRVLLGKEAMDWPEGGALFTLPIGDEAPQALNRGMIECRKVLITVVESRVRDQVVSRGIELPPDNPIALPAPTRSLEAHRQGYLTKLLGQRPYTLTGMFNVYFVEGIVRVMRGEPAVYDKAHLDAALQRIDQRIDCADFDLAFALRFHSLGAGTEQDRQRIRDSALKFRYSRDEPGDDGMIFFGENHPLLFASDGMIAGNLWPDNVFTNSGKKGREQALLGRQRCLAWLDKIEANGYEEFISTTYAPVTAGALMNLVDFSDDPDISRRAARQLDKIYRMMAEHSFDGVMIGPQGRTSRRMLYPQVLTTQALMSYVTPRAVEAFDPWVIFAASSPRYRLSSELDKLMASPIRKQYREAHFLITLNKTSEYMLSSVEMPARSLAASPKLVPGGKGYQLHIWHAALARDCHVFTTHPGSSSDRGDGAPGYWTGNAIFPRQTQNGNTLMQIFSIPQDHRIQFTHAYWPSKAFDEQKQRGHWAFGRKGRGYVALWCSTKPVLHSDVLIDSELRALGSKMAWVCICSGESESGDFDAFIRSCERSRPTFDPETLTLRIEGQDPIKWDDGRRLEDGSQE